MTADKPAAQWEAPGKDGDAFVICVKDRKGVRRTRAHAYSEADAARIVKSVNAFPVMLDALKDALRSGQHACNCGDKCEGTCTFSILTAAIKKAEA